MLCKAQWFTLQPMVRTNHKFPIMLFQLSHYNYSQPYYLQSMHTQYKANSNLAPFQVLHSLE